MKTLFLIFCACFSICALHAQDDRFTGAMLANLEKWKTASTTENFQQLANAFERIAQAEKTQWTPWYYAAFCNLSVNFKETDPTVKIRFIQLAQKQIDNGLLIRPDETELMVLKIMSYYAEMAMDPMKALTLLGDANDLIEKAKSINPENPRIYLMQAEATYGTPIEYGGGKEKAMPQLLLASEKFSKFVPSDKLSPDWGKDRCESLMK